MSLLDNIFFFLRPQGSKLPKIVQQLKDESESLFQKIIPWQKGELELISYTLQDVTPRRRSRSNRWYGIITSIFHESLFVIAVRKMNNTGSNSVVLIRNTQADWVFRMKDRSTVVYLNGQGAARITSDGRMKPFKKSGELGKITSSIGGQHHITIKGNPIGEVNRFDPDLSFNQRAITMIHDFEDDGEELLFLTLVLYQISKIYLTA